MKKLLSLMLVLAMLLSLVPSFAEEGDAVIQENPEAAAELTSEPEEPAAPAEEPAAPAEEPAAPAEEPAAPAEEPAAPAEEPAAPAEEPAAPAEEPAAPVEEPAAPAEEPAAPAEEPAAPAEEPTAPAEEPAAPVEDPADPEEPAGEKETAPEEDEDDGEELESNVAPSVGPVTNLHLTNQEISQVKLNWEAPTSGDPQDGYEICWGTKNDYETCKKNKQPITLTNNAKTITGLVCGIISLLRHISTKEQNRHTLAHMKL